MTASEMGVGGAEILGPCARNGGRHVTSVIPFVGVSNSVGPLEGTSKSPHSRRPLQPLVLLSSIKPWPHLQSFSRQRRFL